MSGLLSKKQGLLRRSLITCGTYTELWSTVHCSCATCLRQVRLNIQHKAVKLGKKNCQFGAYSMFPESQGDLTPLLTGLEQCVFYWSTYLWHLTWVSSSKHYRTEEGFFAQWLLFPLIGSSHALVCLLCPEQAQYSD